MAIELSFLRRIAEVAAAQTLPRFRTVSSIDNKYQVGFDPVTEADREAERAIRALINSTFPAHGIMGEEFGSENLDASHVWVIDPIDGTRAFISGLPVWGTSRKWKSGQPGKVPLPLAADQFPPGRSCSKVTAYSSKPSK